MIEREVVNKVVKYLDSKGGPDYELGDRGYWEIRGPSKRLVVVKCRYVDAIAYAVRRKDFYGTGSTNGTPLGRIEKIVGDEIREVKFMDKIMRAKEKGKVK